jgi:hypothetical protein
MYSDEEQARRVSRLYGHAALCTLPDADGAARPVIVAGDKPIEPRGLLKVVAEYRNGGRLSGASGRLGS